MPAANQHTIVQFLVIGLTGILIMILIAKRKQYNRLTRLLMDLLIAVTMGAFLIVLLMVLFS